MIIHVARTAQPVVREDVGNGRQIPEAVQAEVPILKIVAPAFTNLLAPDPGEL